MIAMGRLCDLDGEDTAHGVAYSRGRSVSSEWSTDEIEIFRPEEPPVQNSLLRALSIIDVSSIRDADVAEQVRGELFGSLLQRLGCFDVARVFHDALRAGRRSGSVSQVVKASRLARSRISSQSLYYYASDLYPSFIGLQEAASVMEIAESAAHRLIRAGQFPFPVARVGRSYKVSVKALMHFMDIPDVVVHADDVENGSVHAGGGAC
ncbi:helix-turn-helix domain-containing protein [Streptomyces cyaneofuscatus]|uniref:helix-turn-helix domain-containing protein n=1 Tax=Streptomyces cyaneofuscatus TaxID=66883 RepID=UPI0033314143